MLHKEIETKEKDLKAINAFYTECKYSPGALITDTLFVAKDGKKIVGAVRLCEEESVLVLRGMYVHKDYQRQGIGSLLLNEAAALIGAHSECYLICRPKLTTFYGTIGFVPIDDIRGPTHLKKRIRAYRKKDPKGAYQIMHKKS
jgi:GNAT superfamily N-acetyltransferase